MHQHDYRDLPFAGDGLIAVCYGGVFFLGAFLTARLSWSQRPALSAILAYGVYLAHYLPRLDWSKGSSADLVSLFIPLITAPIGGFLGEFLFAKTKARDLKRQRITRETGETI